MTLEHVSRAGAALQLSALPAGPLAARSPLRQAARPCPR